MPNKLNAKKYLRVSAKKKRRNSVFKKKIKDLLKIARTAIEEKKSSKEISEAIKKAEAILDRAAGKKIIKKNSAARKKSRLFKKTKTSK